MKMRGLVVLTALGAALAGAPAEAQESGLTIARAIELAQTRNERALQAAARVDAAGARLSQARTFFFPDLTVNGAYTRRAYETVRTIGDDEVTIQSHNAMNGNVTVSQVLFDARAFPLLRQARYSFESVELSAGDSLRRLGYEAADSFIITLTQEQVVAAAERRREFAAESLRDARARFEAGLVSSNDVTRAELELATAEREAARARGVARAAYLALGALLNAEIEGPLAMPADLLAAAATVDPQVSAALALAREQRPDLLSLQRTTAALRELAIEPSRRIVPTLNFVGQFRATNEGGLSGRDQDGSAAVNFAWPLLDGGLRRAERAERLALVREAELGAEALERDIELEIRTAVVQLSTERASLAAADTAAAAARRNLDETAELYRQGLSGALEVADATTQLFAAEVEHARARYELARAFLVYRAASGLDPLDEENPS
ncbi:MAG TPA: TolC family protein [Thermoanaerobaculia bacterium]|nr:TolC family protein [Thermoanaerobaculia bacterium]